MARPTHKKPPFRTQPPAAAAETTELAAAKGSNRSPSFNAPGSTRPSQARSFPRDEQSPRPSRRPTETSKRERHHEHESKPERLHKLLAQSGIGSRREMERMISEGRVNLNGEVAVLGQSASPGDRVKVNGKLVTLKFSNRLPRVILYHKPEGEIVSRDDPQHRPTVFNSLPKMTGARWVAVGRLDFNTSGLLVFTTSGELANRLMHPSYNLVREYAVRILGGVSDEARQNLLNGIELDDGPARFSSFQEAGGEGANQWFRVSLFEGRNREVRRLFEAVGARVSRLMRVAYGPFILPPGLKRGQILELNEAEVKKTLAEFDIEATAPTHPPRRDKHKF